MRAVVLVCALAACGGDKARDAETTPEAGELPSNRADDDAPEVAPAPVETPDAGVVVALDPAIATGIGECDQLISMYVQCDKLPQQSRDAFLQGADQWKKSIAQGGAQAIKAMTESCVLALASTRQALAAVGC